MLLWLEQCIEIPEATKGKTAIHNVISTFMDLYLFFFQYMDNYLGNYDMLYTTLSCHILIIRCCHQSKITSKFVEKIYQYKKSTTNRYENRKKNNILSYFVFYLLSTNMFVGISLNLLHQVIKWINPFSEYCLELQISWPKYLYLPHLKKNVLDCFTDLKKIHEITVMIYLVYQIKLYEKTEHRKDLKYLQQGLTISYRNRLSLGSIVIIFKFQILPVATLGKKNHLKGKYIRSLLLLSINRYIQNWS